jgi:hypothetical protein
MLLRAHAPAFAQSATPFWHDPGFRGALQLLDVEHKIDVVSYNMVRTHPVAQPRA